MAYVVPSQLNFWKSWNCKVILNKNFDKSIWCSKMIKSDLKTWKLGNFWTRIYKIRLWELKDINISLLRRTRDENNQMIWEILFKNISAYQSNFAQPYFLDIILQENPRDLKYVWWGDNPIERAQLWNDFSDYVGFYQLLTHVYRQGLIINRYSEHFYRLIPPNINFRNCNWTYPTSHS